MWYSIKRLRYLKIRCYAARLTELNEYLPILPGSNKRIKMGKEYLNKILLHSIPNGCINQIYTQGFNYETTFKKVINIYKQMKTTKKIYKGVVKPPKNPTDWEYSNRSGLRSKHGEEVT